MGTGIGESVKRVEDKKFLTGKGRYTDDITLPGQTYAAIVRSPHAHAKIKRINLDAVKGEPGFVAAFTGQDFKKAGISGVPCGWQVNFKNGDTMKEPPHPILAIDKVRFVGDAVAVVIAETQALAVDAAEKLTVDYEILPAAIGARKAVEAGQPLVHEDCPQNKAFDWQLGDAAKVDEAIKKAAHVTTIELVNQRLITNAIEPRSAIGHYEDATDRYTLYTSSQNPHLIRLLMCAFVLNLPEHKVRVISPDVGGGFGSKIFHYIEEALVTWCSKQINRPVKWTATRSESFTTDAQGRDHITRVDLALDAHNNFTGLKVQTYADLGAYLSTFAPAVPTYLYGTLLQGLYTTPAVHVDVTAVFTNTTPVDALRGAGRPEATYLLERVVDKAAHELGVDPAELRTQNFIPPFDGVKQEGYKTQVALQYDSGNYQGVVDKVKQLAGYDALRKQQKEARARGKLMGIGWSTYIEACGIAPSKLVGALGARAGLYESSIVRVQPTGKVTVFTGSHSHGQGHETTFAQIVSEKLGIPMEDVDVIHGDTESVPFGMGTYGSRSLAVGGSALSKSLDKVISKATKVAAHKLEVAEGDLEFKDGKWTVRGTDKSIGFGAVSLAAYVPHDYPEGLEPGLEFNSFYDPANFTYPFGAYIAVVEIDPETGKVDLKQFFGCDDIGNVINPMIVDGQVHGGLAHGISQALLEGAYYTKEGQPIAASYMDYAFPRADDFPNFTTTRTVTPCPHNPLGVKGVGEAGTIGSTPAIVNAVIDALWHLGVRDMAMPVTPQRVWEAMNG